MVYHYAYHTCASLDWAGGGGTRKPRSRKVIDSTGTAVETEGTTQPSVPTTNSKEIHSWHIVPKSTRYGTSVGRKDLGLTEGQNSQRFGVIPRQHCGLPNTSAQGQRDMLLGTHISVQQIVQNKQMASSRVHGVGHLANIDLTI